MYGRKKVSKPNKIISEKRIDVLFNIIEWSIFFGFCVVAAIFVKDVWNQFQSKETFMGQSLAPIKKLPTIVFCFDTPFSWWIYHPGYFEIKLAGLSTAFLTLKENETVHFEETNESYDLEQVSDVCFKVNGTIVGMDIGKIEFERFFRVTINLADDYIPTSIKAFFTSEENSYGFYERGWYDGEVFEKVLYPGHYVFISLKPTEYTYLAQEGQCSNETFLDQWLPHLLESNFSSTDCPSPKKCSHVSNFVTKNISLCGWGYENLESRNCANVAIIRSYRDFMTTIGHKRPCHILEYSGKTTYDTKRFEDRYITLKVQFSPPKMGVFNQERLVFDTVGMIGSIGGTLGMCIGFSFSGLISTVLETIKFKVKSCL